MKAGWILFAVLISYSVALPAASKPHIVALGKWTTIKWQANEESSPQDLKVRALVIDGKVKESTTGPAHEVTDRTFVVQRMSRVNDSLPQETPVRWRWEKAGWLLVDRVSGRVQQITLPEFDFSSSEVSWFRDYAAYCGTSDDAQKAFTVIVQLGRRRPLLKKPLPEASRERCAAPVWQRNPVRVTFSTKEDPKLTFNVSSRFVDLASEDDSEGDE